MKSKIDQVKKLKLNQSIIIPWDDPALEGQRPQGPGQFGVIGGKSFDAEPTDKGLKIIRTK